jgi:hypothetical protein
MIACESDLILDKINCHKKFSHRQSFVDLTEVPTYNARPQEEGGR